MSGPPALERGYRRLLGWYPRSFRADHGDEMLAVLMAGARPGQRRPGLLDTADLVTGALTVRLLRAFRARRDNRRWSDGLAVFSFVAPVFVVVVAILEVAVPFPWSPWFRLSPDAPLGGLSLLRWPLFDAAVGLQVIVAAFALLGRRLLTLIAMAASALYWLVFVYGFSPVPEALQLVAAGAYILGAAALVASPGPRRGRQLVTWRHWAVLLLAATFVQVSTLTLDASYLRVALQLTDLSGYLVLSVVLAAVTVILAVTLRLNRTYLLLAAAMFYPYAMQLAFSPILLRQPPPGTDLLIAPTPGYLAVLFGPPLLLACGIMLTAIRPHRRRVVIPAGQ